MVWHKAPVKLTMSSDQKITLAAIPKPSKPVYLVKPSLSASTCRLLEAGMRQPNELLYMMCDLTQQHACMNLVQGEPGPGAEQDPAGKADGCHSEGEGCPSAGSSQPGPAPRGCHP